MSNFDISYDSVEIIRKNCYIPFIHHASVIFFQRFRADLFFRREKMNAMMCLECFICMYNDGAREIYQVSVYRIYLYSSRINTHHTTKIKIIGARLSMSAICVMARTVGQRIICAYIRDTRSVATVLLSSP